MCMRFFKGVLALTALAACSGCGYIHFGRLPEQATATGGDANGAAYTNLLTEKKILQQELALARKEGEALRTALERGGTVAQPELANQLTQTTRELAALRASHAKLQAGGAPAAQVSDVEERLNASMRNYIQLQQENVRLRSDLEKARAENLQLSGQLKTATAENVTAQSTISQLNSELIAQKEGRARAEQMTSAVKAQLGAVMAAREASPSTPAAIGSPAAASGASSLALAKAPPADSSAVAELRTNPDRVRNVESATPAPASPAPAAPPAKRMHVVEFGDTLEKIAQKYYGDRTQWVRIYTANSAKLTNGGALSAGMELEIPEK